MKTKSNVILLMVLLTSKLVSAQQQMTVSSPGQAVNGVYCAGSSAPPPYSFTCECHDNWDNGDSTIVNSTVQVQAPAGDVNAALNTAQPLCERLNTFHGWTVLRCS